MPIINERMTRDDYGGGVKYPSSDEIVLGGDYEAVIVCEPFCGWVAWEVAIPKGSVINSARITFTHYQSHTSVTGPFIPAVTDLGLSDSWNESMPLTIASLRYRDLLVKLSWDLTDEFHGRTAGETFQTPDIKSLINQAVNSPSWSGSGLLTFIFRNTAPSKTEWESFEGYDDKFIKTYDPPSDKAPVLWIDYTEPVPDPPPDPPDDPDPPDPDDPPTYPNPFDASCITHSYCVPPFPRVTVDEYQWEGHIANYGSRVAMTDAIENVFRDYLSLYGHNPMYKIRVKVDMLLEFWDANRTTTVTYYDAVGSPFTAEEQFYLRKHFSRVFHVDSRDPSADVANQTNDFRIWLAMCLRSLISGTLNFCTLNFYQIVRV
jgi:hypothetical protein